MAVPVSYNACWKVRNYNYGIVNYYLPEEGDLIYTSEYLLGPSVKYACPIMLCSNSLLRTIWEVDIVPTGSTVLQSRQFTETFQLSHFFCAESLL